MTDLFRAYEQCKARRLHSDVSVDVSLAEFPERAIEFGGLPDHVLIRVYVTGLSDLRKAASARLV